MLLYEIMKIDIFKFFSCILHSVSLQLLVHKKRLQILRNDRINRD